MCRFSLQYWRKPSDACLTVITESHLPPLNSTSLAVLLVWPTVSSLAQSSIFGTRHADEDVFLIVSICHIHKVERECKSRKIPKFTRAHSKPTNASSPSTASRASTKDRSSPCFVNGKVTVPTSSPMNGSFNAPPFTQAETRAI